MSFTVLIPARLASSRLPNKPLADIAGLPMIVRVAQAARASAASRVVVAADAPSIVAACQAHGVDALLTRVDHPSGSDRLAEACEQLGLQGERYSSPPQRRVFFEQLEQRLLAIPGVQHIAFSNSMPVFSFNSSGNVLIEGRPDPEPGKEPEAFFEQVSLGYFDTMGIRLTAGRLFTSTDTFDRPRVVIINEAMARQFWPNESPLGKRLLRTDRTPFEIVANSCPSGICRIRS